MTPRGFTLLKKKFIQYFFPTVFACMAVLCGSIVDGIIVGNLIGSNAMAAVALALPLPLAVQALYMLVGVGGSTLVSHIKGEATANGDGGQKPNEVFTVGVAFLVVIGLVFTALCFLLKRPILQILCSDATLYDLLDAYFTTLLYGTPFLIFVLGMVYFIRVDGFPTFSAALLLVANAVNLVMDIVNIAVFRMGIAGAAAAMNEGYLVSLVLILLFYFGSRKRGFRLAAPQSGALRYVGQICKVGSSSCVSTMLLFIKTLCINTIVLATAGAPGMTAFSVCSFCLSLLSMLDSGSSETMTPMVATLYGVKDAAGIRYIVQKSLQIVTVAGLAATALLWIFTPQVLLVFGVRDAATVAIGISAVRLYAVSLLFMGINFVIMNYMQSVSQTRVALTVSILRGAVLIIPAAWLFSAWFGTVGIWCAFIFAEVGTLACTLLVCWAIQRRSHGAYQNFLLLDREFYNAVLFDTTVLPDEASIAAAVAEVEKQCTAQCLAPQDIQYVCMFTEDICNAVAEFNGPALKDGIDVLCRIGREDAVLSFRDDGAPFDPARYNERVAQPSNMDIVQKIAASMTWTRMIGLNNTTVVLPLHPHACQEVPQ